MNRANYDRHPSRALNALFRAQAFPHQGQEPDRAKVVVLGIDANYSPDLSGAGHFFDRIIEYHRDGVAFWQKYGVHHPFLLESYPLKKNTGGVPYHRRFTWLGLDPRFAPLISFIELLDVPTTGRTERQRFWELFSVEHARRIDRLVEASGPRMMLLSKSLFENYMLVARKKFGVFLWLPDRFRLGSMRMVGETQIRGALHFSSTTFTKAEFERLGDEIKQFCGGVTA